MTTLAALQVAAVSLSALAFLLAAAVVVHYGRPLR
jgi:hypothetical protein